MKSLYKTFDRYLPKDNYNREPILYLSNNLTVIFVYSFDRKKEVVLTSDNNQCNFRYMSLFEIFHLNWHIIHKDDIYKNLFVDFNSKELPF